MLTDLPTGALIVWTMAATGIAFAIAEPARGATPAASRIDQRTQEEP